MNKACVPYFCFFCVFSIYTGTPASFIFHAEKILCDFSLKTTNFRTSVLETLKNLMRPVIA